MRNNLDYDITIRTTLESPYQEFYVRPSDTFAIKAVHYDANPVYIQAVNRRTRTPVTLNGKQSITLIPRDTPGEAELYSAPNQCKLQLHLFYFILLKIKKSLEILERYLIEPGVD